MPVNTKKILADSFYELCKTTSMRNITPKDIAEHCGLSRQTFYNYFHDKNEIVEYIWCTNVSISDSEFDNYEAWSKKSSREMEKNWQFYSMAFAFCDFKSFQTNWLYENMKKYIAKRYGAGALTVEVLAILRSWVAGSMDAFMEYKSRNYPITNTELSLIYYKNMPPLLKTYFPE